MKALETLLVLLAIVACEAPADMETLNVEGTTTLSTVPADDVAQSLIFMREEEKLARDVYSNSYSVWQMNIFNNISASEEKHTQAVKSLLTIYEIADPITEDSPGQFTNETLQLLYDSLTALSGQSLNAALSVGALIEEIDIRDLELAMDTLMEDEVVLVYSNLAKGSRNHLRSFYKTLLNQGISYQPQVLDQSAFSQIVNSEIERGPH